MRVDNGKVGVDAQISLGTRHFECKQLAWLRDYRLGSGVPLGTDRDGWISGRILQSGGNFNSTDQYTQAE